MTESAQSEIFRSHMIHLLEEQKYDEALPILNDWSETHPSDREMRMYRLLVLRILVLRWNLSRIATGAAIDSCAIAKQIITKLASLVRFPETTKLYEFVISGLRFSIHNTVKPAGRKFFQRN